MQPIAQSIAIVLPEVILGFGAMALLLIGTFSGRDRSMEGLSWGAVILFAAAAFATLNDPATPRTAFDGLMIADRFSAFLKTIIYAAAAASVLLAIPYLRHTRTARFEYPVLLTLATLGMSIMVSAHDLLTLYIGLELLSLASYVLAAFHRNEARDSEAGLK